MNRLSTAISFINEKRKILISVFLLIGMLTALADLLILVQQQQDVRSRASQSDEELDILPDTLTQFASPQGLYTLSYDPRLWKQSIVGQKVIFNLNKEYGAARLDITEGESEKDIGNLTNEIILQSSLSPDSLESITFKDKPGFLVKYKENILGEDTYYYQQIVKDGNKFFIFEQRVPQLGYDKSLLDNLVQAISFAGSESKQVKGVSNASTDLTTVELVDLIRPSIANIIYVYCLEIINLQPAASGLSQPYYNFCSSSKGSGFIVNEKGVVATNGHVVKVYPEEGLITNLLNQGNKTFTTDLIKLVYSSKGQTPTPGEVENFYAQANSNPQYLDRFLTEIFKLTQKKAVAINIKNEKYYVNVGDEPVAVDYEKLSNNDYTNAVVPSATTYTATLVDVDYPNKYSYDAIVNKNYQRGSDVAMLQIENPSNNLFSALELGTIEGLREGSEVVIAGYPTLVEGEKDPRAAISYKSSVKPTITRGIVSSIKQDLTGKAVLQTDASIDHGNSGGPAFNHLGQVIGIATFTVGSETGNFNFLRDIEELKTLMAKHAIDNRLDKLSNSWREGLNEFRNKHFNQAIKYFKEVEELSPAHPTASEFIGLSQDAIANGENQEGWTGFVKSRQASNILVVVFGGISLMSFMSAGFLMILPLFLQNKNKSSYITLMHQDNP